VCNIVDGLCSSCSNNAVDQAAVVFYNLRVYFNIYLSRRTHIPTRLHMGYSVYLWTTSLFHCVGRCSREHIHCIRSLCGLYVRVGRMVQEKKTTRVRFEPPTRPSPPYGPRLDNKYYILYTSIYIIRTYYDIIINFKFITNIAIVQPLYCIFVSSPFVCFPGRSSRRHHYNIIYIILYCHYCRRTKHYRQ